MEQKISLPPPYYMKSETLPIASDHRLVGAFYQSSPGADPRPLSHYDDGDGGLYVFANEFGAVALIRAGSWESAYEIAQDQFMSPATLADIVAEYGENWQEAEGFDEEYGFRPNGASTEFPGDIGIYCKSYYERLDSFPARFDEEITFQTEPW